MAVCRFVDVGAFECLQALLGMSACMFTHVCVCVRRPTSDLFRNKRMHSGGTWRPRGADLLSPPPLTFSLSLFFHPFLSIDRQA